MSSTVLLAAFPLAPSIVTVQVRSPSSPSFIRVAEPPTLHGQCHAVLPSGQSTRRIAVVETHKRSSFDALRCTGLVAKRNSTTCLAASLPKQRLRHLKDQV